MTEPSRGGESRLNEVLGKYFEALEAGDAPSRDELLAQNPDLTNQLLAFFANDEEFRRLVSPFTTIEGTAAASVSGDPDATGPLTTVPLLPSGDPQVTAAQSADDRLERPTEVNVSGTRVRYFGDFELTRELGRGGMGTVYEARQISLNRPVALKLIRAGQFAAEDELRRFQNEAEAVASLDHPHIVPIFEVGEHNGQRYFSMKLIAGVGLDKRLDAYLAEPKAAAVLLVPVAEAIHHAHQRGILHRDLKPANVLVDDKGEAHVTDFGLARRMESDSGLTQTGAIMGTPSFMAPEQVSGRRAAVTTLTDIYGLGAILYALLTGRPPFRGETVMETLEQVRLKTLDPPSKLNSRVPRDLEIVCMKCLEKDARRRYSTAADLALDLNRWRAGEPIAARRVPGWERLVLWARRHPAIAGLSALSGALVVNLVIASLVFTMHLRLANSRLERSNGDLKRTNERLDVALQDVRNQHNLSLRQLYAIRMREMQSALEKDRIDTVSELLDSQKPERTGGIDLRGFEWYYLDRLRHGELLTLEGHPSAVTAVTFSPDGRWIASAAGGHGTQSPAEVRIWDAETGRVIHRLTGHALPVRLLQFSPDGTRLGSVTNTEVKVAGRELTRLPAESRIWDTKTGRESIHLDGESRGLLLRFSTDLARLAALLMRPRPGASGTFDDTAPCDRVKVWDTLTGRVTLDRKLDSDRVLSGRPTEYWTFEFSPDGRSVGVSRRERDKKEWDVRKSWEIASGVERPGFDADPVLASDSARISPDGRFEIAFVDTVVKVRDRVINKEFRTLRGHTSEVQSAAFRSDGLRLASAGQDRTVRVWDLSSEQGAFNLIDEVSGTVGAMHLSPDGRRLVVAGGTRSGSTATVWDTMTGRLIRRVRGEDRRYPGLGSGARAAGSADGQFLVLEGVNDSVSIWDVGSTEGPAHVLRGHAGKVAQVGISSDGRLVASAGLDRVIKLWDARSGSERFSISMTNDASIVGSARAPGWLVFSPDARNLAIWNSGYVEVRETSAGRLVLALHRSSSGPDLFTHVAFSPDSRIVAVARESGGPQQKGGLDGASKTVTVELWGLATSSRFGALEVQGSNRGRARVTFSPDSQRIAAFASGFDPVVWDVATGQKRIAIKPPARGGSDLVFSPDGQRIAVANVEASVSLWDALTGEELFRLPGLAGAVPPVIAFSRDGENLALWRNGRLIVWETRAVSADNWLRREANAFSSALAKEVLVKEDVVARIREDRTIGERLREAALFEVQRLPSDDPRFLNERSRAALPFYPMDSPYRYAPGDPSFELPGVESVSSSRAQYARSLHWAEAAERAAPEDADTLTTLGMACFWLGEHDRARVVLEHAAGIAPESSTVLGYLGLTYAALGRETDAMTVRDRLRRVLDGPLGDVYRAYRRTFESSDGGTTEIGHERRSDRMEALRRDPHWLLYKEGIALINRLDQALSRGRRPASSKADSGDRR
jgi:eukaryotic-like serine/threonine-protein kinase